MIVPRSWTAIELQRDPDQQHLKAEPVATDIRFKLAAFLLFGSWLTTAFSLWHSIQHYKPRNRGMLNRAVGFVRYIPAKFLLTLPLSFIMIAYEAACAFNFSISPLKLDTKVGYMYGLGWAPIAAIIIVYEAAGYTDPNEDRDLIRQRRIRGAQIDAEIGITKKPHWWSKLHSNNTAMSVQDRIARNVSEIGGGRPTMINVERNIEMGNMPISKKQDSHKSVGDIGAVRMAANLLFPAWQGTEETQERFTDLPNPVRGRSPGVARTARVMCDRSESAASGVTLNGPPQQIRSMLDV